MEYCRIVELSDSSELELELSTGSSVSSSISRAIASSAIGDDAMNESIWAANAFAMPLAEFPVPVLTGVCVAIFVVLPWRPRECCSNCKVKRCAKQNTERQLKGVNSSKLLLRLESSETHSESRVSLVFCQREKRGVISEILNGEFDESGSSNRSLEAELGLARRPLPFI